MNLRFKVLDLKLFGFLFLVFCFASCGSVPNLEKPECTDARNEVREFYSFHFGNDMTPSREYWEKRKKFLTENWSFFILKNLPDKFDYFTLTDDYPKAFRIGTCEVVSPDKTDLKIVFFWKDENRSEQREVKVEAVKQNGKWLIDKVEK